MFKPPLTQVHIHSRIHASVPAAVLGKQHVAKSSTDEGPDLLSITIVCVPSHANLRLPLAGNRLLTRLHQRGVGRHHVTLKYDLGGGSIGKCFWVVV